MNLLLDKLFSDLFPTLDVECGLINSIQKNAFIVGHQQRGHLFVTTAAIERIHDAGLRIHNSPVFQPARPDPTRNGPPLFDDDMATLALAALLGHELGHLHDRQFDLRKEPFTPVDKITKQAQEFAADTWGLRACVELVLAPLVGRVTDVQVIENALCVGVTRLLIGHNIFERLDWKQPWVAPEEGWPHDHPPGTWRLLTSAIAVTEWLQEHTVLPHAVIVQICVASLDTAARALHWYATGQCQEPGHFLRIALERNDGGAKIDHWRAAYERFQHGLIPERGPENERG